VAAPDDPFAWLRPAVIVDPAARTRLADGELVVRVLPATDGELAVFAAARLNAGSDRLAEWVGAIAQLKKSPYVLQVRRFSDPPVFEDLQDLTLDDADLADLRTCRAGDCAVKLTASDMALLRRTADSGGVRWKEAVQQQFRRIVWDRLRAYQADGFGALSPYADRRKSTDPQAAFGALAQRSPYLTADALLWADRQSFFYWSKEQYGAGKPVIGITHVEVVRPCGTGPLRLMAVSREIFATHYRNASLGVTAVSEDASGIRYLVYVNRSQVDVLGGIFGGWKRSIVEGRLKSESADVFSEVRRRLESGPPPE
jgi:hypothetical protein